MSIKVPPGALCGATEGAVSRQEEPDVANVVDHPLLGQPEGVTSAEPVRGRGVMTPEDMRHENATWRSALLDENGHGRDPFSVPLDVLAAAGHPRRSLSQLRRAMATTTRGRPDPDAYPSHIKTYRSIRAHCHSRLFRLDRASFRTCREATGARCNGAERTDPTFPRSIKLSPGCCRWKLSEIEVWEAAKADNRPKA